MILTHTAHQFKQNEVKTLGYIQTRGLFDADFSELAASIYSCYNKYRNISKTTDFLFNSDFDMIIEKQVHRVVLHAEILDPKGKGNYDITSYSLGICAKDDPSKLIRRFHFDYVHDNPGKKQKVPLSHLQYGGKSGTGTDGKVFNVEAIEFWLSEPRLNFPPINIALLLDIVFCEFSTEKTKKIVEDPAWRSLIKDNENFMLGTYYQAIAGHIGSPRHTNDKLVRDFCYATATK